MTALPSSPAIGVLNEQPLHAALKRWYAQPDGRTEVAVDGFVVDVVRGRNPFARREDLARGLLIEIQVGNFSSIKRKVRQLTEHHALRLVYPIPREKWLLKMPKQEGGEVERRKSPKRGRVEEVFKELVSFPALLSRDTFSLEVVFTREEELRHYDPDEWRNRGWVTDERRLLEVVGRHLFEVRRTRSPCCRRPCRSRSPPQIWPKRWTGRGGWRRRWRIVCGRWAASCRSASAGGRSCM
jgi:hypothetical protein